MNFLSSDNFPTFKLDSLRPGVSVLYTRLCRIISPVVMDNYFLGGVALSGASAILYGIVRYVSTFDSHVTDHVADHVDTDRDVLSENCSTCDESILETEGHNKKCICTILKKLERKDRGQREATDSGLSSGTESVGEEWGKEGAGGVSPETGRHTMKHNTKPKPKVHKETCLKETPPAWVL